MKSANTYLLFDGNCREAITFYGECFKSEPNLTPFSTAPSETGLAQTAPERILHAEFASGPFILMASDTMPGMPFSHGTNFSISLSCESEEELQTLFAAVGQGGVVTMAIHDAFWGGRFGMLTDRFGINWMFSFR